MDWSSYDNKSKSINFSSKGLTSTLCSFEHAPSDLESVYLACNQLTSWSWEHAPPNLEYVYLRDNLLTSWSWEHAPPNLKIVDLGCNRLTSWSWDHAPPNLEYVGLWRNQLTSWSWEHAPINLKSVYLEGNQLTMSWSLLQYKSCMKIKKAYKRHYNRRKIAAKIITEACHDWVWKPNCRDGTIGIRPRLDMEYLLVDKSTS